MKERERARQILDSLRSIDAEPPEADFLSRYEFQDRLGEGAVGVVSRGFDRKLSRPVAIKWLRAPDEKAKLRFQREVQSMASLAHPNVVGLFDAVEEDGLTYLVMELVEGQSLRRVLEKGHPNIREAVRLVEKIARGVGAAHAKGIIHRDLKPENVLITKDGDPKVGDFGLAHIDGATMLTRPGEPLGTPLYMAPEQVRGDLEHITPRTDVYAIGIILYEFLTGRSPHRGDSIDDVYSRVLRGDLTPPLRVAPDLPRELERIVLKCLEGEPDRRYEDASALADDLGRWLEGFPILARPPSPYYLLRKWAGRHKAWITAAASLLALCLLSAVIIPQWRWASLAGAAEGEYAAIEKELDLERIRFYRADFRLTDNEFRKYEGLMARARKVMDRAGASGRGWYLVGRCCEVLHEKEEAVAAYDAGLTVDPEHGGCNLQKAKLIINFSMLYLSQEGANARINSRIREALVILERLNNLDGFELDIARGYAIIARGEDARPYCDRMLEKWKRRDFREEFLVVRTLLRPGEATADLTRALDIRPGYYEALAMRGLTYLRQGEEKASVEDWNRAIDDCTRSLEINPRFAEAYVIRSIAYYSLDEAASGGERAFADANEAIRLAPRMAHAYVARALLRVGKQQWEAAERDASKALEILPTYVEALVLRGNARRGLGNIDASILDYSNAIHLDPTFAPAWLGRGIAHRDKGQREDAIADLEKCLSVATPGWKFRAFVHAVLLTLKAG